MTDFVSIGLVVALLAALSWSTLFSFAIKPPVRGLRNFGILASYISPFVFMFVSGWKRVLLTWMCFAVAGGLVYILWELVDRLRTPEGQEKPSVSASHIFSGLFAWPIMIPEAVEYCLAEFGVLATQAKSPDNQQQGAESKDAPGEDSSETPSS